MDVVRLFTNLLAVHRQQLQALAVQGEIQTEALAQLLEKEEASLQSQVRAEESRRQEDFSYLRYDPERGPRELGQGLESAAQHWLRPERRTAAEVVRCVALQRFVSLLPTHVGDCVLKQCPQDMEEAIYMAEDLCLSEMLLGVWKAV
uniref:SCAN box domain-containing protein n=1 Tax=Oncorhynchus mykiss TaxID=8022 RepID=A0A8C7NM55_ONCMY